MKISSPVPKVAGIMMIEPTKRSKTEIILNTNSAVIFGQIHLLFCVELLRDVSVISKKIMNKITRLVLNAKEIRVGIRKTEKIVVKANNSTNTAAKTAPIIKDTNQLLVFLSHIITPPLLFVLRYSGTYLMIIYAKEVICVNSISNF